MRVDSVLDLALAIPGTTAHVTTTGTADTHRLAEIARAKRDHADARLHTTLLRVQRRSSAMARRPLYGRTFRGRMPGRRLQRRVSHPRLSLETSGAGPRARIRQPRLSSLSLDKRGGTASPQVHAEEVPGTRESVSRSPGTPKAGASSSLPSSGVGAPRAGCPAEYTRGLIGTAPVPWA